ncbi:MAG: phosphate ABC transporter ATP-binding protein [Oscillospiraceae bacterium]|jgi:phosphate transport system ATP-binding protein|nr:phosphate ABC transporter ATP-binding protein [Oscillospiraceae bacterium]
MTKTIIDIDNVSAWYGGKQALFDISLEIPENSITAFVGPSGCGKTTLLRSLNRLNDLIADFRLSGAVHVGDSDIYANRSKAFVQDLRKGIGMVFQQPNPLPDTVMKNLMLPLKEHYKTSKAELKRKAVDRLKQIGLFDELSDRLNRSALHLSGGQQQRLCIARAMMLEPRIILFDEPCSALDPKSTFRIEDLLQELKQSYTIVMVTHNLEQARRISDRTAFFYLGKLIESGETLKLFSSPETKLLSDYITGRM